MKSSDFIFDCVNLLYYKCHRINQNHVGSYVDSPDWIKKAAINSINNDDKCFQYAATIALNHEKIGENSQRLSKIKPFINKYDWKGINYPSGKDNWKKFEENNSTITLMC